MTENAKNKSTKQKALSVDWTTILTEENEVQARSIHRLKGDRDKYFKAYVDLEDRPQQNFSTGSSYTGQWDKTGMTGFGTYIFPHGVEYEGWFEDGTFHGKGTLTYPTGQQIDGVWEKGHMVDWRFRFSDGLAYDEPWTYCVMPDRRFLVSMVEELQPAGQEYLTNEQPTRKIPKGCYDTVDGFYSPTARCIISAHAPLVNDEVKVQTDNILRIPTKKDEEWIKKHCRKAWDEPTGYRPDLYEYWTTGKRYELDYIIRSEGKRSQGEFRVSLSQIINSRQSTWNPDEMKLNL